MVIVAIVGIWMAVGKPFIATKVGSVPEVVKDKVTVYLSIPEVQTN